MRTNQAIFRYIFALLGLSLLAGCGTTYGIYHKVQPGETLGNIAQAYGVEVEALEIINNLDGDAVEPGREVFVPGARSQRYVRGGYAQHANEPDARQGEAARRAPPEVTRISPGEHAGPAAGAAKFAWPVKGVLFSKFGKRDGMAHDGIDISAPEGTEVRAAADGRVIYAGDGVRGYGNLIIVKHEGFYSTVYAHNQENLVDKGDFIEAGQVIAKVGQTGRASGPHLHFEIRYNSKPVNPIGLLPSGATHVSER